MYISYKWLKNYTQVPFSPEELVDRLTMVGLEVGSIAEFNKNLNRCIISQIKEISPHPHADKLTLCQVDIGEK